MSASPTFLRLSAIINVELLLYLLATTVALALRVVYFAMFIQAILSWFVTEDNTVMAVLSRITAPVVLPVRALLFRIPALSRLPIDLSFLVAFVLLVFLMGALPTVSPP